MALPVTHTLFEVVKSTSSVDASNGKAGCMRAPFKGTLVEAGSMISSVLSTADATCTVSIAGTAVTGGNWVITQSSSAIGDLDFASVSGVGNGVAAGANTTITAANTFNEGDLIKYAFTGSGTAGGPVYLYAVLRKG